MKNSGTDKLKKFPLLTYLCYLLVVSILFTGVTFSRYSAATSGDLSASVASFVAGYEIDNISSNTYTNANFWLDSGTRQGTPRTMRFNVRNYEKGEQGEVVRISDVDLQAYIRVYLPAEFADNLVLQLTQGGSAVTPQIVIGNLLYELNAPGTAENAQAYYTYAQAPGSRVYSAQAQRTIDTALMRDYNAVAGADDEVLDVQGTLTESGGEVSGTVVATGKGSGISLSVSASNAVTQYSLGFRREAKDNSSDIYPQLFLDLEKRVPFYTIDISLGKLLSFSRNTAHEEQFVLYLSLAENIPSEDYNLYWDSANDPNAADGESWDYDLFLAPAAGEEFLVNGATVTGYHFDLDAETYDADGNDRMRTTQVRLQKTFERDESGTYTGRSMLSFSHVAPVSETTVNYIHPIDTFFAQDGSEVVPDRYAGMEELTALYGVCSNLKGQEGSDAYYRIGLGGLSDDPLHSAADGRELIIHYSLSKSYFSQVNIVFVQTSQSGGGA